MNIFFQFITRTSYIAFEHFTPYKNEYYYYMNVHKPSC